MLDKIKPNQADALQHRALMHLTLRTIGETHRIFYGFQDWLVDLVRQSADEEGNAQAANLLSQMPAIDSRFRRAVQDWVRLFGNAREQAASLPFGVLLIRHNSYMGAVQKSLQEDMSAQDVGTIINLWQRRRQLALQTAQQRVMGDGLNLDNRIWRLENDGINQIRRTLASAMAQRTNAYTLASALEDQLGADQDMPQWTAERLYGMTARERTKSKDGLITAPAMRGEGVSYKALRLARTELQFANHAVTTEIAQHSPWVTGRNVTLSPAHPKSDVCDGLAAGGPYEKDSNLLPAHPNCLCFWTEVLMKPSEFTGQVKGWLSGENEFLNDYQQWLGTRQITEPLPWGMSLADSLELWLSTGQGAQAAALGVGREQAA